MIIDITSYIDGREFKNVEVTTEDELFRGCDEIAWVTDEKTFERYTIYEDCITHLLYAVKELNKEI